jgi:hypothetical protein
VRSRFAGRRERGREYFSENAVTDPDFGIYPWACFAIRGPLLDSIGLQKEKAHGWRSMPTDKNADSMSGKSCHRKRQELPVFGMSGPTDELIKPMRRIIKLLGIKDLSVIAIQYRSNSLTPAQELPDKRENLRETREPVELR